MNIRRIDFALNVMMLGFFWLLVGVAWVPSNKLYQQVLVLLFWFPVLFCAFVLRAQLLELWQRQRLFFSLLVVFLIWACLSASWSRADDIGRELKRVFYVFSFLCAMAMLGANRQQYLWKSLGIAFVFIVLTFPVGFYLYYIVGMHAFSERLWGVGQLAHPILGGYVMALAVTWGMRFFPKAWWMRLFWAALMAMGVLFVVMGQSRGALFALIIGVCVMLFLSVERHYAWLGCAVVLVGVGIEFIFFEPFLMSRGMSYRLDILMESLAIIMQNPLLGMGLGSDYRVVTYNYPAGFDHAHNSFTHTGIELGCIGLLLWIFIWLFALFYAWRARQSREGQLVFSMLLLSIVALQFDTASQWGTPRAEWFVTWLPIGFVVALNARRDIGVSL